MAKSPRLAAVLIVRNEEHVLARCLRSLQGIVDEIHVHDTGSTDATPTIAAEHGAKVTHGEWPNSFAVARNRALANVGPHVSWVLSIDADEEAVADPAKLRRRLANAAVDQYVVDITNFDEDSTYTHRADRLFRPARCRWEGELHEHIVPRSRPTTAAVMPADTLALRHTGYADADVVKVKAERNLELAQAVIDRLAAQGDAADPTETARAMYELGRSLVGARRRQEAVDVLEMLRELFPGTPQWLLGTDFLARHLLMEGMPDATLVLVEQMRAAGASPMYCDWVMAHAMEVAGAKRIARRLMENVTELVGPAGIRYERETVERYRRHLAEVA
ncbi:hypothetical protein GCM10009682_37480 [Luedemannella flava]|uniref:Glycosyltransferase 2-like domain-containing protein n=1 Tax=Luedemannella flava TaxID=349316 RepID=A0ABN2M747_9ACTN